MSLDIDAALQTYTLTIHDTPPSKNQTDKAHWRETAEHKRLWRQHVAIAAHVAGLQRRPVHKVRLSATIRFADHRRRDIQNYAQTLWHWTPDALQHLGIIPDDTPTHVEFAGPNLGVTIDPDIGEPLTTITVEIIDA